jgi:phosphoribosylformylglycinamidine (FGAM) synthase-like enzyme
VLLVGETREELGGSEYLRLVHGLKAGPPPEVDLQREKRVQEFCLKAIEAGLLRSAHDLSEGGLALALAESSFHAKARTGCDIAIDSLLRPDALAFGETQSRILVSCRKAHLARLTVMAREAGVPLARIGRTGGRAIVLRHNGRELLRMDVETAFHRWKDAIPAYFRTRT